MILVDTAVLLYPLGGEHPLQTPCRHLFDSVSSGQVRATTTIEVIQEFTHVRSRRWPRPTAVAEARSYAQLLGPLQVTSAGVLDTALDVYARCERLGAFEAFLAAVALDQGAALVSADRAFGTVPGLHHLDPGAASFLDDVAATG